MSKQILFLVLTLITIQCLKAQSSFVGGVFPTIDHSGTISRRLDYSLYYFGAFPFLNFNTSNNTKTANFLLFYSEQALTFKASKNFSFTGAYVYQKENVTQSNFINENRIHIQAAYKHAIKAVTLKHRLRLDNRFVQNRTTGETPYTHRVRYLFGVDFPVKHKMYFTLYQEAFFNTFKNASAVYAENWAYTAIGFNLNQKNKIETGPLYITWNTGGNNWFHQYYLQLTWVSHFDFTKPNQTN